MKRIISLAVVLSALLVFAVEDKFVYSEDGVTGGSGERMLPVQAVNKKTGRVEFHLKLKTDAERADCGWYRVIRYTPVQTNYIFTCTGHVFHTEGELKGTCDQIGRTEKKPYYKTYTYWSKWKIFQQLSVRGKWTAIETWMANTEISGVNLKKAWDLVQVVSDESDLFVAVKAQAAAAIGMTEEEVDEMLTRCVDYTKSKREDINR